METLKECSRCKNFKNRSMFHKRKEAKDGLVSQCKVCRIDNRKKYYSNNKSKELTINKRYYNSNKDIISEHKKAYYLANKDSIMIRHKDHYNNNKYMYHIAYLKRQKVIKQATLPGHESEIGVIYKNRPKDCHVDHIIPLQGINVSGLHVPWNLQYLSANENLSKGNKA